MLVTPTQGAELPGVASWPVLSDSVLTAPQTLPGAYEQSSSDLGLLLPLSWGWGAGYAGQSD